MLDAPSIDYEGKKDKEKENKTPETAEEQAKLFSAAFG